MVEGDSKHNVRAVTDRTGLVSGYTFAEGNESERGEKG